MELHGRETELVALGDLLDQARQGISGALVVRGDPGIGKTALLTETAQRAKGFRILRAVGTKEEAELPFAGLHLLLRSDLDRIDALPRVQADALRGSLGLASPGSADRFLVGLAVLSLLAEIADQQPLLVVVDDAQWLDRASADALVFAARRLDTESVVLLFGARPDAFAAAGLPELSLAGLSAQAAAELLGTGLPAGKRYRVLSEAAGNPLALLELPRLQDQARADGPLPLTDRLRDAFAMQLDELPERTRTLLLVAAAAGTGELIPVLRAATTLGASLADLDAARDAGLIEVNDRTLAFRHPLIRAAVQHAAPLARVSEVHQALALAVDDPGRRAWHQAEAATEPDERIAAELERVGVHGTAAWYERAADLSVDPEAKARRLARAAETAAEAGDLDRAAALASRGLRYVTERQLQSPRPMLLQVEATAAFLRGDLEAAFNGLLEAAGQASGSDMEHAVKLLVEAVHVGWYTGERELAESVAALERLGVPNDPQVRLLLRTVMPILGRAGGDLDSVAAMDEARKAAGGCVADLILISGFGLVLGHDATTQQMGAELTGRLRDAGRIGYLPSALFYMGCAQVYGGQLDRARPTVTEAVRLAQDTGQLRWVEALAEPQALLAAACGEEVLCRELVAAALRRERRSAWSVPWTASALGLLDLGLGRVGPALDRLETLAEGRRFFHIPATRSTPDLVEAAVRLGRPEAAAEPLSLYEAWARTSGQDWAAALVHRCHALLDGDERRFRAALDLHERDDRPFDEARTRLLYGEWLRREKRKSDARVHLGAALETLERIGATPWAERARTELTATGTTVRRPAAGAGPPSDLTPQELQIVRLAARGLSNKDIATQLFLSPRTVGHHLYKAYPKLGVLSRAELADLPLD